MQVGFYGVGRYPALTPTALLRDARVSIALCNESEGVYLGEQKHVPQRGMEVEGRRREGVLRPSASVRTSCQFMIYALA